MTVSADFITRINGHKGILYKICRSYCSNPADRDDLAQEMIVQIWRSYPRFDEKFQFTTWMYRIALNVAISWFRKARSRQHLPIGDQLFEISSEDIQDESADLQLLQQFISELKPLDKALMILYLEDKSHQEIADVLGMSVSNVGTKVGRIKTSLRQKFSQVKT